MLGLSLVFVFLILAALYESWSLPFSVLLSTPVAVLGALIGIVARHFDNNVYAQIGLVMLVGLTAKNAILIVEFAKDKLEDGLVSRGRRARGRKAPASPDPDDVAGIHLWLYSALDRNRCGSEMHARCLGPRSLPGCWPRRPSDIFIIPALFVVIEKATGRRTNAEDAAPESDPSSEDLAGRC